MTSAQIENLYRELGEKKGDLKDLNTWQKVKYYAVKSFAALSMILITPMIIIYVLYKRFVGDGKISLRHFFGLRQHNLNDYVREQQELQGKGEHKRG